MLEQDSSAFTDLVASTKDLTESHPFDSLPTQEEIAEDEVDAILPFRNGKRSHTHTPRLAQENRHTRIHRPGWVGRPPNAGNNHRFGNTGPQGKNNSLICYSCYERGLGAPSRILSYKDLHKVLNNYEALSPLDRLGVPSTIYHRVTRFFERLTVDTPVESESSSSVVAPGDEISPHSESKNEKGTILQHERRRPVVIGRRDENVSLPTVRGPHCRKT